MAFSEALNALAIVAEPEKFGELSQEGWSDLKKNVAIAQSAMPGVSGSDTGEISALLPQIEQALARSPDSGDDLSRLRDLARKLISKLQRSARP